MKTDNYIKAVLTVIAVSLVILVLQNAHLIGDAQAVSKNSYGSYALVPVNPDGSINVAVKSTMDVMDVNIKQVGGSTVYDALPFLPKNGAMDVNIKELGGSTVYDGIPVFTKGKVVDVNIDQVSGFRVYDKIPVQTN